MTRTEFELDEIDPEPLERLAVDLLTRQDRYRGMDPQGKRGRDDGKDGLRLTDGDGTNVILHVSRRADWDKKFEEDLEKTADHERTYDTVVFVTNRSVPGTQKPTPAVAKPFVADHSWGIDIWDRDRLSVELDNHHQDLRSIYLRITPTESPATRAKRLIKRRVDLVRRRSRELPVNLVNGPAAVLHIVPHDAIASTEDYFVEDLPHVLTPGTGGKSGVDTEDGVVMYDPGGMPGATEPQQTYAYIDVGGWIEFVDTYPFQSDGKMIRGGPFEKGLVEAYMRAVDTSAEVDQTGSAEVCLSLLDVEGYTFATGGWTPRGAPDSRVFRRRDLVGEPYTVELDDPAPQALQRAFDRTWRGARRGGSPNYTADGQWKP